MLCRGLFHFTRSTDSLNELGSERTNTRAIAELASNVSALESLCASPAAGNGRNFRHFINNSFCGVGGFGEEVRRRPRRLPSAAIVHIRSDRERLGEVLPIAPPRSTLSSITNSHALSRSIDLAVPRVDLNMDLESMAACAVGLSLFVAEMNEEGIELSEVRERVEGRQSEGEGGGGGSDCSDIAAFLQLSSRSSQPPRQP